MTKHNKIDNILLKRKEKNMILYPNEYFKNVTQIISRKVGHSSVQTTDRVYSHFFEDEFKNVPNVMEEFLAVKAN